MEKNTSDQALWFVFDERKKEIAASKDKWFCWFIGNIAVLFAVATVATLGLAAGIGFAAASWLVFGAALPLIYSAIFFHAQHAKAREYLEEYSFKSIVARSIDAARKTLKEDVNAKNADEQKKYLDFLMAAMRNLYIPPREIISKHPVKDEEDVKVGTVEKIGDVFKKFIPGKL